MTIKTLYPDISPSLLLDFANAKHLDSRISFTRNSTGTYVDANGVLKTADPNLPRFDHDPITGESFGLLVEESRTNQFTYSEAFNSSVWNRLNLTATADQAIAPDGTNTADKIGKDSAATETVYFNDDKSITSGNAYTQSIFVKAAEYSYFQIAPSTGFPTGHQNFDLVNGVLGTSDGSIDNASITAYPNGWYRCTLTVTSDTSHASGRMVMGPTSSSSAGRLDSVAGSVGDGIYVWGAQLEVGSFPTSYIPTSGSAVTRVEDTGNITGENFSSWFNQTEGTYLVRAKPIEPHNATSTPYFFIFESANSGDFNNAISIGKNNTDNYRFRPLKFSNLSDTSVAYTTNQFTAAISGSGTNDGVAVLNGSVVATSTGSAPGTQNHNVLCIGDRFGGTTTGHYNGTISKLVYYPKRLINDQLQTLTK